jgi:hypothetical protein
MYDIEGALRRRAMAERLNGLDRAGDAVSRAQAPADAPAETLTRPRHRNDNHLERRRPPAEERVSRQAPATRTDPPNPRPETSPVLPAAVRSVPDEPVTVYRSTAPSREDLSLGKPSPEQVYGGEKWLDSTTQAESLVGPSVTSPRSAPEPIKPLYAAPALPSRPREADPAPIRPAGEPMTRGEPTVTVLRTGLSLPPRPVNDAVSTTPDAASAPDVVPPALPSQPTPTATDSLPPIPALGLVPRESLTPDALVQPKPASEDESSTSSAATIADLLRHGRSSLFFDPNNRPKR